MVILHPFLVDFLHWRTRRTHRSTTLCRACGHTAHAVRPNSRQFLMGLRVDCIKMEEQLSLLENPLLKVLLLEDERSDWVNPIFDEREKCGGFHTLFPLLLEQAQFFRNFRMGPETFWVILHNIRPRIEKQSNFRKCTSPEERLSVTLRYYTTHWHTRPEKNKMIWFRLSVGETYPCTSVQHGTTETASTYLNAFVCSAFVGRVCQCKISAKYGCSVNTA